MRKISLDEVQPGMILAKDVFGETGQILLRADIEMKPRYLNCLEQVGIESIYIRDNRIKDVEVDDAISEKTRHEARLIVREIVKDLQHPTSSGKINKSINVQDREILNTVNKIIDELLDSKDAIVQLVDIRTKDNYLFAHSVNCAVLATLVAKKMKYKTKELRWVATGALFHDLGMAAVPPNIANKPGELTDAEFRVVKEHPLRGYEIFKTTDLFDARAGAVILQHHERFRGQGYPRGLAGEEINPLAQLAGIADVYDALTSERPYRNAYKPHEAVEMLMSWGEELFEITVLQHFLSAIAAYPIGSHILLSNGESGLVVANNPGFTLRPVVRVLYTDGEDLAPHPEPYDLDLSQVLDLTITKVLE
jgi:HD-GYP domain-containing protein (c-di-GMP phosphodiesterase class II)